MDPLLLLIPMICRYSHLYILSLSYSVNIYFAVSVDVGGYSNKSYMHNDLFNIDSDEEVLPARDRSVLPG